MRDFAIISVAFTISVLALMASQLDIDISLKKGYIFPTIKIKFKKDSSLFAFLRPPKTKQNIQKDSRSVITTDEPYINKYFHGRSLIQYGENTVTKVTHEVILQARVDNINEYYYYIADSNAKFKGETGFLNIDNKYKKIREFNSWDATQNNGVFSNLNKITLPIKKLRIGQELNLRYRIEIFIHYKEVLTEAADITFHAFFFRLLNTTEKAVFEFHIPKGVESECITFDYIVEYNKKQEFKHSSDTREKIFELPNNYGNIWIRRDEEKIYVNWTTNKTIPQGSIYKLRWYTGKLSSS